MFKRTDAPYAPGRRGKWWLKLKRSSDARLRGGCGRVGHGKRAQVLSDYTFAVRGPDGLVPIGKAYSGLTDAEIAELTIWFLAHRLPPADAARAYAALELRRREIPVEPAIVVEIAFDVVQRSALHASLRPTFSPNRPVAARQAGRRGRYPGTGRCGLRRDARSGRGHALATGVVAVLGR